MSSSLARALLFATVALTAAACERQTYTCCVDGLTETCSCPRGDLCMMPRVSTYPDGSCELSDPMDSGGDSGGDSAAGG